MENYNTGKVVPCDQITDYQQAAHDFAEGDQNLENLLTDCFQKGIKTIACCKGHEEKDQKPYFSFEYSYEQLPYIKALLASLGEKGYDFRFTRRGGYASAFGVHEKDNYDYQKGTFLFQEIQTVLQNFDKHKDYGQDLSEDLKSFLAIARVVDEDPEFALPDGADQFQFSYMHGEDAYQYAVFTDNTYYNQFFLKEGFRSLSKEPGFPTAFLETADHKTAAQQLKAVEREVDPFFEEEVKVDFSTISFQNDPNIASDSPIVRLKIEPGESISSVSQKLQFCKEHQVPALAVFNGVSLQNYGEDALVSYDGREVLQYIRHELKQKKEQQTEDRRKDKAVALVMDSEENVITNEKAVERHF